MQMYHFPITGSMIPSDRRRGASTKPWRPAGRRASPATSGSGTGGRCSWTSPCGLRASAASACRSRVGITASLRGSGTAGGAAGGPMSWSTPAPTGRDLRQHHEPPQRGFGGPGRTQLLRARPAVPRHGPQCRHQRQGPAQQRPPGLAGRPAAAPPHRDRSGGLRAPPAGRGGHTDRGSRRHRRPGPVFGGPRRPQSFRHHPWAAGFVLRSRDGHHQRREGEGPRQVHGRTPDRPATTARISDAGQEVRDMWAHILLTGEYR